MSNRFGSSGTGGTSFGDGGRANETTSGRFGAVSEGGNHWDADTILLASLVDVTLPSPLDGYVLTYDSITGTWKASAPTGGAVDMEPEIISIDIDFSNQTVKDVTFPLTQETRILIIGRLYIDADPGAAFDEWATYTFYDKVAKKGENAYYRSVTKLSYTELEVATTGSDANITPDDHTIFAEHDIGRFIDDGELVRIHTIGDTLIAEDNVGVHSIDTGLSRISEFSGITLYNAENATTGYFRVEFDTAQTVSLKMDLMVVR